MKIVTDVKPTEEQVKKFWEKCGFRFNDWGDELFVIYPDNVTVRPDILPIDLNNLFRYAIPKYLEIKPKYEVMHRLHDWLEEVIIYGEESAKSLFWACYKAFGLD